LVRENRKTEKPFLFIFEESTINNFTMNEKQAEEMINLLKQIWYKLDSIEENLENINSSQEHNAIPDSMKKIMNDINREMNSGKKF